MRRVHKIKAEEFSAKLLDLAERIAQNHYGGFYGREGYRHHWRRAGGYVAAIRAAQLGGKVTLIEKEELGRNVPELGLHSHEGASSGG